MQVLFALLLQDSEYVFFLSRASLVVSLWRNFVTKELPGIIYL